MTVFTCKRVWIHFHWCMPLNSFSSSPVLHDLGVDHGSGLGLHGFQQELSGSPSGKTLDQVVGQSERPAPFDGKSTGPRIRIWHPPLTDLRDLDGIAAFQFPAYLPTVEPLTDPDLLESCALHLHLLLSFSRRLSYPLTIPRTITWMCAGSLVMFVAFQVSVMLTA